MHHYHLMTDQDLVRLFQGEDERAFEELLYRHKDRLFSTIYFLVRDRDIAEDLFQDSFIRIINGLRKNHYNEEGKFIAWAAKIARNTVIDYFRAEKKAHMVRENDEYSPFHAIAEKDQNPLERMMHHEKAKLVELLIENLPETQREVVVLRHYAGLSFKEISATLNVNMNTCLGRMRNAVIGMKEVIAGKRNLEKAPVVHKKRGKKPKAVMISMKEADEAIKKTVKKE